MPGRATGQPLSCACSVDPPRSQISYMTAICGIMSVASWTASTSTRAARPPAKPRYDIPHQAWTSIGRPERVVECATKCSQMKARVSEHETCIGGHHPAICISFICREHIANPGRPADWMRTVEEPRYLSRISTVLHSERDSLPVYSHDARAASKRYRWSPGRFPSFLLPLHLSRRCSTPSSHPPPVRQASSAVALWLSLRTSWASLCRSRTSRPVVRQ